MIYIKTFTAQGAERALKNADHELRRHWNTYGFKRTDSHKTAGGFVLKLEAPELHWRDHTIDESELLHMFDYCDDLLDAQVI